MNNPLKFQYTLCYSLNQESHASKQKRKRSFKERDSAAGSGDAGGSGDTGGFRGAGGSNSSRQTDKIDATSQPSCMEGLRAIFQNVMILLEKNVTVRPNVMLLTNQITLWPMGNQISLRSMKEIRVGKHCSLIPVPVSAR